MTSTLTSEPSPTERSMSGREKTAWIWLVSTVLIYVPYFIHAVGLFRRPELLSIGGFIAPLLGAIVAQSVIGIAAALVFLLPHRSEPKDERDLAVEARAFRWGYYVLAAACVSVVMSIPGALLSPLPTNATHSFLPILIAEILLLGFVVAEIIRYLLLAIGYRRGA